MLQKLPWSRRSSGQFFLCGLGVLSANQVFASYIYDMTTVRKRLKNSICEENFRRHEESMDLRTLPCGTESNAIRTSPALTKIGDHAPNGIRQVHHSTPRVRKAQIDATRDESQWIVGQSPLSTLTIPGCCYVVYKWFINLSKSSYNSPVRRELLTHRTSDKGALSSGRSLYFLQVKQRLVKNTAYPAWILT